MEIIEVKQNWPDDTIRIDLTIGNFCNYKCWYCWPGSNEGNLKWPEFDTFIQNLSHLLNHYLAQTNKSKFDFHVMGGEVTHWPNFIKFIKYFKEKYNCIFSLTTNGSKKIEFWKEAVNYLDYVTISTHHEYSDIKHLRELADFIYKKNVLVNTDVLMDPFMWDKCMNIIEYYKQSKHKWSIRYLEIINNKIQYTEQQKNIMSKLRARGPNIFWFLKNNKSYRSNVKCVDKNNKTHKVNENFILLNRLNYFKGWECTVGVNWISVKADGTVAGICGNKLFNSTNSYNLFEQDFIAKFNPIITATKCDKDQCWCKFETNMPKKAIPII